MDLFEQQGFGRLDPSSFGLWLNVDKALAHKDYHRFGPLMWSSFHFALRDEHRTYLSSLPNGADRELVLGAFTLFTHEARHFHDLLLSPYGSMLMRQYTRAALLYLFLRQDLLFQHKAIFVPLSDWVTQGTALKRIYSDLDSPSHNIIHAESAFRSMKEKLRVYNRGRLNGDDGSRYPTAVSILEASAILMQETAIARDFGASYVESFRRGIWERGTANTYYSALSLISQQFERSVPAEVVSYLLTASLCGNFQDPDTKRLQYPTDILVELLLWLRKHEINLAESDSFEEIIYTVDEYFEETHGGDVMDMMKVSTDTNRAVGDAFRQELDVYEEQIGREYPEARSLLAGYNNFCEVHTRFVGDVCVNPLWYCSSKYLEIQRRLPTPVIFIETELGIPVDEQIEQLYYIQFEERLYLADLPEEYRKAFNGFAADGKLIRLAHILSPRGFKTDDSAAPVGVDLWHMDNSAEAIKVDLWQRNHDAVGSLRFLIEGPGIALSKHVQRDLMSAFTLVGTKVYGAEGEIKGELPDVKEFDGDLMRYIEELRQWKSRGSE
jgi:hypothetical protein